MWLPLAFLGPTHMVPLWASPSCDSGGQKNTGTVILNSFMGPNFITAPCSHTSPPITYVFSSCFTAILDGKQANHRFWKFLIDLEISGYLISSTVLQVGSSSHYNLIWQKRVLVAGFLWLYFYSLLGEIYSLIVILRFKQNLIHHRKSCPNYIRVSIYMNYVLPFSNPLIDCTFSPLSYFHRYHFGQID